MNSSSNRWSDPLYALRAGEKLSPAQQAAMVFRLSLPAILAEMSMGLMRYIDAAMVGRLGAGGSAAIGLVNSTTWFLSGICGTIFTGFVVLTAHSVGAGEEKRARGLMKEAFLLGLSVSLVMAALGASLSGVLPRWLGGGADICKDASRYLLVYSLSLPLVAVNYLSTAMLQASGNMRVPSILNILMCFLDVVFNYFLIFPSVKILGAQLPGAGLGVLGAALGTALATLVAGGLMLLFLLFRSPMLRLRRGEKHGLCRADFRMNFRIAVPVVLERGLMSGAQVAYTGIVAPLGTVSLAANTLALNTESICYLPGFGIGSAATTVIGQSIGAKRDDLTRRLGWLCVGLGAAFMGFTGMLMYFAAPWLMSLLTPDAEVVALGAQMLRIVAFVEPFYAVSLVCAGVFRGAGDTRVVTVLSFVSMWLVRLPMARYLAPRRGLRGVWIAMSLELAFRGVIFLCRLAFHRWENTMKKSVG